jgi:hypothetical protein
MSRQGRYDRVITELAARQHGVASRRQLLDLGVPDHVLDERVASRRLIAVHRGVYAVGHRELRREGRWLAAVLARGPATVLSHQTAAILWGMGDGPEAPAHVTKPRATSNKPIGGVIVHRAALASEDVAMRSSIPVTSVARTTLDLAQSVRGRALEQVIRRCSRQRLFDLGELWAVIARASHHPGAPELGRLLTALHGRGTDDLRSAMEVAFAQLCDDFGLPRARTNRVVCGERVDFSWPDSTLIVETDGFEFHAMPTSFANDRRRDQKLTLAGTRCCARPTPRSPPTARRRRRSSQRCCNGPGALDRDMSGQGR